MIRLRELRERHGYTVKEMCTKLGVDDSRYRKWEAAHFVHYVRHVLRCAV